MPSGEVLEMIPSDTLARIRQADPHPMFKVFSIGHEGDANANIVGKGMRVLSYARDIIVQMFNKVKVGLPALHRHDPKTNDHTDRPRVGEVVGKTLKLIDGVMHTLTAFYIKPEFRNTPLDIASIEGSFEAEEIGDGSLGVVNLTEITGIALSDKAIDTPGMPGATLQAALQMFTLDGRFQQMAKMTKEEIKAAIAEAKLKATDLFDNEDILDLQIVKESKQTEYEHAKRVEKKLGEAREENMRLQGDLTKLQGEKAGLLERANQATVKDTFSKIAGEKKLDPKFQKYVEKNLVTFKSAKEGAEFEAEVGKFVDAQAKEYTEMGKIYGFEAKVSTEAGKTPEQIAAEAAAAAGGKGGVPNTDGKGPVSADAAMTDPKSNDFIPAIV